MYFAELKEIRKAAAMAANREGVPFYVISDPSRKEKRYTALSSRGFGLPSGFLLEEIVRPNVERVEIDPPEKTSTNGF